MTRRRCGAQAFRPGETLAQGRIHSARASEIGSGGPRAVPAGPFGAVKAPHQKTGPKKGKVIRGGDLRNGKKG